MRILSVFLGTFFLISCAQILNGQIQPVIIKDKKEGVFYTTCSGIAEDWNTCYSKAKDTCPNGYTAKNSNQSSTGIVRELTFQCKK